jgi:hypothetical protein
MKTRKVQRFLVEICMGSFMGPQLYLTKLQSNLLKKFQSFLIVIYMGMFIIWDVKFQSSAYVVLFVDPNY